MPAFSALPARSLDEIARRPVGIVEPVGEVVEVDVRVERVVDPVLDAIDVGRSFVDEVAHLADQDRTDREHEHAGDQQDDDEHQAGRGAAPPPAAGERVDGRFDRERQEERDEQRDQQRAQRDEEPLDEVDHDEAEPEQRDRLRHPRRHPFASGCRIGRGVVHGPSSVRPRARFFADRRGFAGQRSLYAPSPWGSRSL